jgi:hypothetical protein
MGEKGVDMMMGEEGDSLCSTDDMAPLHTDFISGFDIDHFAGRGDTGVTSDIPIVHIQDRVVRRGDADTVSLAVILSVDADALCDGVCRTQSG